jgi:hypothetical protein
MMDMLMVQGGDGAGGLWSRPGEDRRDQSIVRSVIALAPAGRHRAIVFVANQRRDALRSSSAASEVTLAWFGLRIIRAMQPSAVRGKTAECVARLPAAALSPGRQGDTQLCAGSNTNAIVRALRVACSSAGRSASSGTVGGAPLARADAVTEGRRRTWFRYACWGHVHAVTASVEHREPPRTRRFREVLALQWVAASPSAGCACREYQVERQRR